VAFTDDAILVSNAVGGVTIEAGGADAICAADPGTRVSG